jgi:methylated-DNA-[protein]-cysteine S-methyltransferase
MTIRSFVLDTPIGPLALLTLEIDGVETLVASGFTDDVDELAARLHPSLGHHDVVETPEPGPIAKAHAAYFDGDLHALDAVPVHQPSTPKRERLWAALREVPAGTTVSYGQLAANAGLDRAARAAGQACSQNLVAPAIPCHRVLPSGGGQAKSGGYAYGVGRKQWLLEHEAQ